ncbi:MAG TPA: Crp/Fnr family transcriptional regulator [Candidatus Angelobacter sp.]|nr:Crp/Fnr family transcriptional regulator [Candidatus Angelobacter sp.]
MVPRKVKLFDPKVFLAETGLGRTILQFPPRGAIYAQGELADTVFYIQKGRVKLTVVSKQGKEATVGLLSPGDFFGEGCIAADHPLRMTSAAAHTDCSILKIKKKALLDVLHRQHEFSDLFVAYIIMRNNRIHEDLVDQLFNSAEKRLARTLLLLARFGKESKPEPVLPKISQETLAEMVGTTRERINLFMNRFRKLGYIDYNGELEVHSSLLEIALHE